MADYSDRSDCYFYSDVRDMAAHIPTCDIFDQLGYCPCDVFCKYYLERETVDHLVRALAITLVDKHSDQEAKS